MIIIEDAAHALGATYKNKKIGSIGDMTMFSFHPVKHITTGEGVITTNNLLFMKNLFNSVRMELKRIPKNFLKIMDLGIMKCNS